MQAKPTAVVTAVSSDGSPTSDMVATRASRRSPVFAIWRRNSDRTWTQ